MENIENTGVNETNEQVENKTTEPSFTDEQKEIIAKMIQSESDRRTNQALAKQKKEYEKQLSLSKLDGDAREKAEKDNRIAELEALVSQMNTANNKSELKSVLASRGLSAEFADIINITEDLEASQANIDKLDKLFKAAVKAEVEKRLAGSVPKGNGNTAAAEITKESAKHLSLAQINDLAKNQPELYQKLFG